jgi:hypothetical protein
VTGALPWGSTAFAPQAGSFSVDFDATPNGQNIDGVIGLSNGPAGAYTDLGVAVRFAPIGATIDVRNGGGFSADATVPYLAGDTYHFRVIVDIPSHTYSVYVTAPGSDEQLLAANYAFRSEQSAVASLDEWTVEADQGSCTVCNFEVPSLAFVQDSQAFDFSGDSDAGITSAFLTQVLPGDLLVAAVTYDQDPDAGPIAVSVTDSNGNVFVAIGDVYDSNANQGFGTFYAPGAIGGPGDVVQAAFSPATNYVAIYVAEYSGLDPQSPLAASQSAVALGALPGADAINAGVDVQSAPALVWGFAVDVSNGQPAGDFAAGTGFTSRGPSAGVWGPIDFGHGTVYTARPEDLVAPDGGPIEVSWSVVDGDDFLFTGAVFQVPDAGS